MCENAIRVSQRRGKVRALTKQMAAKDSDTGMLALAWRCMRRPFDSYDLLRDAEEY